jgi:uncharacterized protein YycO
MGEHLLNGDLEIAMQKRRSSMLAALVVSGAALVGMPVVSAYAQDSAASTPKEVKKAQRKAARAKKNAELKQLEKNGYNPNGSQNDYPQNLQNAQKKIDAQKAGAGQ